MSLAFESPTVIKRSRLDPRISGFGTLPVLGRDGWRGMKCVDTIARIRCEFFVQGKTIKEIVRELHVSRNTVRKVIRSVTTAFEYERSGNPAPGSGRGRRPSTAFSHRTRRRPPATG